MKCVLCHMPFRPKTGTFQGDEVWVYRQENEVDENHFHVSCFRQTQQGSLGMLPHRFYTYGNQVELF